MINYWAMLQKVKDRRSPEEGVEALKMVIGEAYSRAHAT
jgi:hypothetical protein